MSQGNFIVEDDLEQEIQQFLLDEQWQSNPAEAKQAARRIIKQLRERNYILCLRGPQLYGFVHRTFLEYLTAAQYVLWFDRQPQRMDFDELLALFNEHCHAEEWHEVLRLICGQINDKYVGKIVKSLAINIDFENNGTQKSFLEFFLITYCLGEVRTSSKIEEHLSSVFPALNKNFFLGKTNDVEVRDTSITFLSSSPFDNWTEPKFSWSKSKEAESVILKNIDSLDDKFMSLNVSFIPIFMAFFAPSLDFQKQLISCKNANIRLGSISTLIGKWKDEDARNLLEEIVTKDKDLTIRITTLSALCKEWKDKRTRIFCEKRVVDDNEFQFRCIALEFLANNWRDEQTRKFLEQRAINDKSEYTRSTALRLLAEEWVDKQTRRLLEQRIVDDSSKYINNNALQLLAEKWADQRTQKLIHTHAITIGFAAMQVGTKQSQFGQIVFTINLNGTAPYLDPTQSIPTEHIQRAAEQANIPFDQIDATVRSLSEYMGWDITKGSTAEDAESSSE